MEIQLIEAAKAGDKQAFSALFGSYERRLYQAAYSFLRDLEASADVVQEALLRAYKNFSGFDETRPLYPWLYRITRNLCLNQMKSIKRHGHAVLSAEPPDERQLPETEFLKQEECRRIRDAIDVLPEQAREIILLKHFQDCCYADMADILDIPIGTVMSRLYNARKLLKGILEKEV